MSNAFKSMLGSWATGAKVPNPDVEFVIASSLRPGHKVTGRDRMLEHEADEKVVEMNALHGGAMRFWKERV
jgi:hypothetical protein